MSAAQWIVSAVIVLALIGLVLAALYEDRKAERKVCDPRGGNYLPPVIEPAPLNGAYLRGVQAALRRMK